MKKLFFCLTLIWAGLTTGIYAKGSGAPAHNTSVTVVSDTTGTDDDTEEDESATSPSSIDAQMDSAMQQAFGGMDMNDHGNTDDHFIIKGFPWPLDLVSYFPVLLLLIIGLPLILVAVILYLLYRNRRDKYELERSAMAKGLNPNATYYTGTGSGQPGPQSIFPDRATQNQQLWEQGIRQICLGAGLALLLGFIINEAFSMIGILISCIGIGKVIIARSRKANGNRQDYYDINRPYHIPENEPAQEDKKDKDNTPQT